jgi:co-chaperonin GroES (HSP10)
MSKFKIIPQGKRILLQLNPVKELSKKIIKDDGSEGKLFIPDNHSEESRIAIILAIGDKVENYKPGDKVLVPFFVGTVMHFPGEGILDDTIRMATQEAIWAKIEE